LRLFEKIVMGSVMRQDSQRMIAERCWMLARLNAVNRAAVLRQVTRDVFPRLRESWSNVGRKRMAGFGRDDVPQTQN
jgi:hypothetical protein